MFVGYNYCRGRERGRVAMLKKRIFYLIPLLTLFLLLMVPLASADLGTPINSRWAHTIPTINGVISPGEWTDATVRNFTFNMMTTSGTSVKNVSARFLAKNDYNNIYAAIQIFNIDYNQLDQLARWDTIALFFDDNHNHILESGEQGEGISTNKSAPYYYYHDLYYDGSSWITDNGNGGTENGALAWNHTAYPTQGAIGNYTVEMKIPLAGPDGDAYDLAITLPPKKTIGYKIWFYEGDGGAIQAHGVYPDNSTITNNFLEITDASTYGNLILHPLYTLTVQTTAGGTTNPLPGAYQYDFGEVATVSASPYGGYVFDHWELNLTNVGSANPYFLTMDNDYTLKAVFKPIPPPSVGGMAAPILIQINEPNLLSPLIWLASVIIPIALTVVFVKLKKKKL